MKGLKTMKIIRNVEKKPLQERIRQCDFTIRKCEENLTGLKLSIQSKMSIDMNDRILALFARTHSTLFEKSKNHQRQKFARLQSTQIIKLSHLLRTAKTQVLTKKSG